MLLSRGQSLPTDACCRVRQRGLDPPLLPSRCRWLCPWSGNSAGCWTGSGPEHLPACLRKGEGKEGAWRRGAKVPVSPTTWMVLELALKCRPQVKARSRLLYSGSHDQMLCGLRCGIFPWCTHVCMLTHAPLHEVGEELQNSTDSSTPSICDVGQVSCSQLHCP